MPKFWDYIHDDSDGRVLRLEGPIDSDSFWGDEITPQDFRDELYAEDGDLTLWINSPGGNVFAAAEIYTMIRDYPHNVTVRIASIAASAASVIAMAGNTVQMSPTALLMIHDPSTIAFGNAKDMEKAIATLNEVKESIINAYAAKTGLSRNRISKLMPHILFLRIFVVFGSVSRAVVHIVTLFARYIKMVKQQIRKGLFSQELYILCLAISKSFLSMPVSGCSALKISCSVLARAALVFASAWALLIGEVLCKFGYGESIFVRLPDLAVIHIPDIGRGGHRSIYLSQLHYNLLT